VPRAHSGANKSKESAGKREVTHRGMGTRGGTGAFRTGVQLPHLAALLAHVSPLSGRIAAKSMLWHYDAASLNTDNRTLVNFQ